MCKYGGECFIAVKEEYLWSISELKEKPTKMEYEKISCLKTAKEGAS